MKIKLLDKTKKERFIEKISYLGVEKIPYLLIKTGEERVRAFSGSFANKEIYRMWSLFPIEGIGLYLGKEFDDDARLSIDALHLLKDKITKNIIEVNETQEQDWFRGKDIVLNEKQIEEYKNIKGFVAVKSGEDFIGTGKMHADCKGISNFLPKERRIRNG